MTLADLRGVMGFGERLGDLALTDPGRTSVTDYTGGANLKFGRMMPLVFPLFTTVAVLRARNPMVARCLVLWLNARSFSPFRSVVLYLLMVSGVFATGTLVVAQTPSLSPASALDAPFFAENLGRAYVAIDGAWAFHPGDNLAWAAPGLDDSQWARIQTGRTWEEQGFRNLTGFAWYRRRIVLERPAAAPNGEFELALGLPYVEDSAEVYWNGRLIGRWGSLPPHPVWFESAELGVAQLSARATFSMPLGAARSGVLAIRVWKAPYVFFAAENEGGLVCTPVLGTPAALDALASTLWFRWLLSNLFTLAVALLAGIASLLAFFGWLRDRSRRLLFWMALYILHPLLFLPYLTIPGVLSFRQQYGTIALIVCLEDVSLWFLLLYLLELTGNRRLVLRTRWLAAVCLLFNGLDCALQTFRWWEWPGHRFLTLDIAFTIPPLLMEAYPLVLISLAVRRRLDRALWFLAITAALADFLQGFGNWVSAGLRWTHWDFSAWFFAPLVTVAGNDLSPITILNTLLLVAVVTAVWRYERQQRLRQLRDAEEFRSAQEVQRVLVPESLPEVQGYAVASVYKPALEVGGDFFQIIPCRQPSDSALLVVGDVSGKGLKAAMTVSLIVGALRTLADTTTEPAEVLAGLNRRLHEHLRGGFSTCIAVRLDPDGRCLIANAGHLAPYRNGIEIPVENGLPLGIVPEINYSEVSLQLAPGDILAFVSDGVIEAQNQQGALFGFERTQAISTQSAETIAAAAQAHGQEDDITVLTLTFAGVENDAPTGVTSL